MMGKEVDLATVVIASFHISHTQVALLILLGLTVSSWRDFLLVKGLHGLPVFYFTYLLLGLYAIALGYFNGSTLKYVLGSAGIFYYSLFFYIAFVLVNSDSRRHIFLSALFYSWLIGALIFIAYFAIHQNGNLPFGYRNSSDLLPMLAGCLFVLMVGIILVKYKLTGSVYIGLFALFFVFMMKTKSVTFSTILIVTYLVFNKYLHHRKAREKPNLEQKLGALILLLALTGLFVFTLTILDVDTLDGYVRLLPISDREQFSLLIRLYMWKDILMQIIAGPIWGHGLVPFDSELIAHRVLNVAEWSKNANPHNSYLILAYYVGWAGLFLFLMFLRSVHYVIYGQILGKWSGTAIAIYMSGGVFLLAAMSTPVFEEPWLAPFMWALMGVACRQSIAGQNNLASATDLPLPKEAWK
jgi:hypothetical protein